MTTIRREVHLLWLVLRYFPDMLGLRLNRVVLDMHRPQPIGPGGLVGCLSYGHRARPANWPCKDFVEASERLVEINARVPAEIAAVGR